MTSPEAIAEFVTDALETGDVVYIAKAMGVAARAKGMTEIARETGLYANSFTDLSVRKGIRG